MPGDKDYGAEGSTKVYRFTPGVDNVVSVLDERHFMHGKVNTLRYANDGDGQMTTRNLALTESIRENGVEQPGVIWWKDDVGHIISGTRRWTALETANSLRVEENLEPFAMRFEVNSRWDETTAREKWRRANQDQEPNDILTRLQGAALDVERGVAIELAAEVWAFRESQLQRATAPGGILDADDSIKEALATGALKLSAALRLCQLPKTEQRAALLRPKAAGPKSVAAIPLAKLRTLRDLDSSKFNGISAHWLINVLTDESFAPAHPTAQEIRTLLSKKATHGPKPRQPALPGTDGLTADERATTQRFLDREAEKREAAEAA